MEYITFPSTPTGYARNDAPCPLTTAWSPAGYVLYRSDMDRRDNFLFRLLSVTLREIVFVIMRLDKQS